MRKQFLIYIFLILLTNYSKSQIKQYHHYGFNIGLIGAIGTHVNRLGIALQAYYFSDFFQLNSSIRVYDNFKDLGPIGNHFELNSSLGFCFGYGKKNNEPNYFISSIGNQTPYAQSIAYCYNIWFNKIKTSQATGILSLQFNKFYFIIENDLLAWPELDRYRTGAFLFQYQDQNFQYAVNCTLWTGKMGSKVINDSIYPYYGYMDTVGGRYSNLSHGLLSAQIKFSNLYGQYLQANAGTDAEQIRHFVQNRLIHDLIWIPKRYRKSKNCHIPMIDNQNKQYLFRYNQKIKPNKLYLNGFVSPNIFY